MTALGRDPSSNNDKTSFTICPFLQLPVHTSYYASDKTTTVPCNLVCMIRFYTNGLPITLTLAKELKGITK